MSLLEIDLPSGFIADREEMDNELRPEQVKRVDYMNSDTNIVFYFDMVSMDIIQHIKNYESIIIIFCIVSQVTSDEVCVSVFAIQAHEVHENKPRSITLFDYYNPRMRATIFYSI